MKAAVYERYGPPDVLHLAEVDTPVPGEGEVRVRVRATTVNYGDKAARNFKNLPISEFNMPFLFWIFARLHFGISKPKITILGNEFSGQIDAVGSGVTRFREGDEVFGYLGQGMGAYAEYLCMPEDGMLAAKPSGMTYEQAAALPAGAIVAVSLLREVDIQPGQRVLVNGASGGIGSAAVQIAKRHYGAHVTGVCGTPRRGFVRALGADEVIDYTQEDFTQNGETYDVIFDILGRSTFARCKGSLNENGRYLRASFKLKQLAQMLWTSVTGSDKRVICALSAERVEDLVHVAELVEDGTLTTAIDRTFPLGQAAEAHRYVESGDAHGKIVITVGGGADES